MGIFRLVLALFVVVQHVVGIPIVGHYAVHGFFILSGYLMTYIMHNTYGFSLSGTSKFCINRFLRLFPTFWFASIITIYIIYVIDIDTRIFHTAIYLPTTFTEWLQNASMIYFNSFPGLVTPRLLPATWALTLEITFYLLIALGVSKNKKLCVFWLAISLAYFIFTMTYGLEYKYRYNHILSGSLPFALGSLLYFYKDVKIDWNKNKIIILSTVYIFNLLFSILLRDDFLINVLVLVNYFLTAALVSYLINLKMPIKLKSLDNYLGKFSYPIYLFHWSAALVVTYYSGYSSLDDIYRPYRLVIFIFTIMLTIPFSLICVYLIENKIEAVRTYLKNLQKSKI